MVARPVREGAREGAREGTPRRRPGRPPKAEAGDTKAALLDAALRLFAQKGYAGTSIRAIAREVGLSESVLYAHFDSKRGIFEAALRRLGPLGVASMAEDIDQELIESDPPQVVRDLVARTMAEWDTEESHLFMSLMARDALAQDPSFGENLEHTMEDVGALFRRWIDAGWIRPDIGAPPDLAFALLAPLGQARLAWLHATATPERRAAARERGMRHAELFIRAVFRDAGRGGAVPGG